MDTNEQIMKRGRGRPPKPDDERLNDGKLTVYMATPTLNEMLEMAKSQGLEYSQFARQAILIHMERFRRAA